MNTPMMRRIRPVELASLLWEFSESDVPTFVLPNTAFGLLAALAAPALVEGAQSPSFWSLLIHGVPRMLLFNWANVFIFELANQRLPESVKEDMANKPWRPLPRGRISQTQTRQLLLGAVPAVLVLSAALGAGNESALILLLAWMYNDLRGGDELSRDIIIAIAYDIFLVSSLRIGMTATTATTAASAAPIRISTMGHCWLAIIGCVIATTMQVQDLKDQVGDRLRSRKTWPIVLGDEVSRWWIAACVPFWSFACVLFWKTPVWVSAIPVFLGLWVCACVLLKMGDAKAWRWWCLWQVALYGLPIYSSL
ncbi:UbiA prenyltransferase family [Aspergillus pseudoustus]|uniref:UbiA prenyltransferase family n=1 Tax=Aspergillus pseudoustus TaxID=1810923 RepID=A0ABR4IKZ5_9EURO